MEKENTEQIVFREGGRISTEDALYLKNEPLKIAKKLST